MRRGGMAYYVCVQSMRHVTQILLKHISVGEDRRKRKQGNEITQERFGFFSSSFVMDFKVFSNE